MANATRTTTGHRAHSHRQRVKPALSLMATLFLLIAGSVCLISCQRVENVAYSHYVALADGGWDPETPIGFNPWPLDSLGSDHPYDMYVTVRFLPSKAPQKLPLIVIYENEGAESADTIVVNLLDNEGEPLGKKMLTTYEVETVLKENFKLTPGLTVDIAPLADTGPDAGLLNIGVRLFDRTQNDIFAPLKNFFNP